MVTSITVQKISIHLGVLKGKITMRILETKKGRWKNARTKGKETGKGKQQLQDGNGRQKAKARAKAQRMVAKAIGKDPKDQERTKGKAAKATRRANRGSTETPFMWRN